MADDLRRRGGEQHERVRVGLLAIVPPAHLFWAALPHRPDVAAVHGIAMPVPDEVHAMVDEAPRVRPPEQPRNGEGVDHTRRRMDLAWRRPTPIAARQDRLAVIVEHEEAAVGVDAVRREKIEQPVRLPEQPAAVVGQVDPARAGRALGAHWVLMAGSAA